MAGTGNGAPGKSSCWNLQATNQAARGGTATRIVKKRAQLPCTAQPPTPAPAGGLAPRGSNLVYLCPHWGPSPGTPWALGKSCGMNGRPMKVTTWTSQSCSKNYTRCHTQAPWWHSLAGLDAGRAPSPWSGPTAPTNRKTTVSALSLQAHPAQGTPWESPHPGRSAILQARILLFTFYKQERAGRLPKITRLCSGTRTPALRQVGKLCPSPKRERTTPPPARATLPRHGFHPGGRQPTSLPPRHVGRPGTV